MAPYALTAALTDRDDLETRELPGGVVEMLTSLATPPRLAAHLRAVHDVACALTDALGGWLAFDADAVRYGAAVHDIGKVVHVEELSGPGHAHEEAGYAVLLGLGVPERLARFARTHASWSAPGTTIEDLLVRVADKVWKAARVADLEELLVDRLVASTGAARWEAFMRVDDILTELAQPAERRLAFQSRYPVMAG